jgi:hypothetical protein
VPKRTPEVIDEICRRISEGEPLRAICRDAHMPSWRAVYDWLSEDEEFAARIARARDLGFDAIAQEAMAIADTPVIGEETEDDGDRVKVKRGDMLGHRRLQVETRLKLLSKWCPKRYGEQSAMQITGADGGALVFQVVTGVPVDG